MIGRLTLFAVLVGLLAWIPTAATQGFETRPVVVTALLGIAALMTFWRHHPTDDG
ncbi:hypothetical protein LPC08_09890 [Roseomonas sp. OT10]|uniref:hypothetical protein n=1 Tax=Roseomonas cutis TaxID=2897332 RepID=UPI001E3B7715|nr:hypothetical protein [Roseomonas sp. OT10]UFN50891.1 hypothetical protein LPC08_09890 [Roseomonas sp. OT10]